MHDISEEQVEQEAKPQISIDITPTGFHVEMPETICLADIKNILVAVRDLLVECLKIQSEEKLAQIAPPIDEVIGEKDVDNSAEHTDNTSGSFVSESDQPERG
jgi:hypothetical protein